MAEYVGNDREQRRATWEEASARDFRSAYHDRGSFDRHIVPYPNGERRGAGGMRPPRGRGRHRGYREGRYRDAEVRAMGWEEREQHESERGWGHQRRGRGRPPSSNRPYTVSALEDNGGRNSVAEVRVTGWEEREQHEPERGWGRPWQRRGRGRPPSSNRPYTVSALEDNGGRNSDAEVGTARWEEREQHESERGRGYQGRGRGRPSSSNRPYFLEGNGGRNSVAEVRATGWEEREQHEPERGWGRQRRGRGRPPSSDRPYFLTTFPSVRSSNIKEGKGRGKYIPTCVTFINLRHLSELDSAQLVQEVDSRLKDFQTCLQKSPLKKPDEVGAVVRIFMKLTSVANGSAGACSSDTQRAASRIVSELLSERSEAFHFNLKKAVKSSTELQAQQFIELFLALLTTFGLSAWSCLPIDELKDVTMTLSRGNCNSDLVKQAEELVETRNQVRDTVTNIKQPVDSTEANRDESEFKTLPILPEWKEINKDNGTPPEVRPNKVQERYSSWMQYYNIQFHLVREDFIAPLRRGIHAYLQGERGRSLRDVKTYSGVTILSPVFTRNGICFEVKFDASRFKRTNWDHSKRLIFGSFLCFFPLNKCTDVLFATVANRDSKELQDGYFMAQFEDSLAVIPHCKSKTQFEVVESSAYFEATRPILQSLQQAEVETMPFTKQLIEGDCGSVASPVYLRQSSSQSPPTYDLSCLYGSKRSSRPPLSIQVLDEAGWSAAHDCELDESQLNAIQMALTQEVAVIQGPPGTGKTYVGLKIVEALLENRHVWDPENTTPILVMCYTNHALDQFLEGIIETECHPTVVRIGGRCKNRKVEEYNINKIRASPKFKHSTHAIYSEILALREKLEEVDPEKNWKKVVNFFTNGRTNLLPLDIVRYVADPDHYYQLSQIATCETLKGKELEVWLDLWEKKRDGDKRSTQDMKNNLQEDGEKVQPKETRNMKEHQESEDNVVEKEELIEIQGQASLAGEMRMLSDDVEGFKPLIVDKHEDDIFEGSNIQEQQRLSSSESDSNSSSSEDETLQEKSCEKPKPKLRRKHQYKPRWCRKRNADSLIQRCLFKNFMKEEETNQISDICELDVQDRWRLYNFWAKKRYEYLSWKNKDEFEQYSRLCRELAQAKQREDHIILEQSDVIGMTTTGAAKYQHILHHIKPKIVIVEEAAEVLEAHIVSALSAGTQHLILIGDHKQLRPKPNEHFLGQKYKFAVSLFERLVLKELSHATLQIQHRMRPEIARLVCPHVYEKLLNHESVTRYPDVRGVSKSLFFIQHNQPENEDPNLLSYMNEYEAEYMANLCSHFLNLGYLPNQITVLTPYVGQLLQLQSKMPRSRFQGVRIVAIDNFQGEENDIILFSMVRSTSESGKIGFLKEDNRVCVSLSRAKQGFYAIGNFHFIRKHSLLWESIISDVEDRECLGEALPLYCHNHPSTKYAAKLPSDFANKAPNGGCNLDCDFRLPCGHVCTQKCHVVDSRHETFMCKKLCTRVDDYGHQCNPEHVCSDRCPPCRHLVEKQVPTCGHKQMVPCYRNPSGVFFQCKARCSKYCKEGLHLCSKLCYEKCGECEVLVSKIIPVCGHSQDIPCYTQPTPAMCQAVCQKVCDNGLHQLQKLCNQDWSPCKEKVEKMLECGHTHSIPCSINLSDFKCPTLCLKELCSNGHKCNRPCHFPHPCEACEEPVNIVMPVCHHTQMIPCYLSVGQIRFTHHKCEHPCEKELNCGHKCTKKCGESCEIRCKKKVVVPIPCGHTIKTECYRKDFKALLRKMCEKPCLKMLMCGHPCREKCYEPCTSSCRAIVVKQLPCGHESRRPCFQTTNFYQHPCEQKCHRKLPCGHKCKNACGQPCSKCNRKSVRKYPCGHSSKIPCSSTPEMHPCQEKCQTRLKCGHICSGKCGDCYLSRIHASCPFDVKIFRYCGHIETVPCIGLSDYCHRMHQIPCFPTHNPSYFQGLHEDYVQCLEPCKWECPHFPKCRKGCGETCDRPWCNQPCKEFLPCGHICPGVCGEPCLKICPKCSPEIFQTKFHTSKKKRGKLPSGQLCVELNCGHIFTVEYLDNYMDQTKMVVAPKQCPTCHENIQATFRYGNATKDSLYDVMVVDGIIRMYSSVSEDRKEDLAVTIVEVESVRGQYYHSMHMYSIEHAYWFLGECKKKLRNNEPVCHEEDCFIRCLMSFCKLHRTIERQINTGTQKVLSCLEKVITKFIRSAVKNYDEIITEINCTYQFMYRRTTPMSKIKLHLSWQLLDDLKSELYRLALTANCAIAEDETKLPSPQNCTSYLQSLDPLSQRISDNEFQEYSKLIRQAFPSHSFIDVQPPSLPPVIKGRWMKCHSGHYYCQPPVIGMRPKVEMDHCPQCL